MKILSYQISDLFNNPGSPLGKIVDKINALQHFQALLEKHLEPTITQHCRLGQYENGIITLLTHSAAIATQLRFQVPQLLSTLRQDPQFAGLRSIQIKIAQYMPSYTDEQSPIPATAPQRYLSAETKAAMRHMAETLTGNDPATLELIASLKKLGEIKSP